MNVHCSPAKEVFFHNSQLDKERLLEKSQNPREIRTCSLPIARHKRWPLCHRDVIEQSWTVENIRMRLNIYDLYIYIQRRAIFKIIDVFVMCCEAPLRLCVKRYIQARTGLKFTTPPFRFFFGTVRLFFEIFLMSPKGPPFEFFCYFATECVFINQKGSPLLHFSTLCDIFRKKFFSKISSFFPNFKFCAFWALDIAPTWDVPVLFFLK